MRGFNGTTELALVAALLTTPSLSPAARADEAEIVKEIPADERDLHLARKDVRQDRSDLRC